MPRTSIPGFDPNITVGALEGGILVSNLLFGIVTMQVYLYYQKYPRDHRSLKALVRPLDDLDNMLNPFRFFHCRLVLCGAS
jgi:hypothetical protein